MQNTSDKENMNTCILNRKKPMRSEGSGYQYRDGYFGNNFGDEKLLELDKETILGRL
jgi:hypothetical protein